MSYKINVLYPFERELKRLGRKYHSIKKDYMGLLDELYLNPDTGVNLGNGIRKVRMNKTISLPAKSKH
jgi:mRNA-degrading endonuclease RelE of RelBE toxin-antitoxin system